MGNGRNHLYSTTALTDDVGNVVERYTYDAYGKRYVRDDAGVLKADQSGMQAYGFTGRQLDTESGLWYFRARYFDDELGRFVNRDPAGYVDGMSLYSASFVPITTDAYGLWTQIDRKHTREYALICSNDKSDTWANLAEKAGMEPSEYNLWVTDDDTGNLTQDKTPKMTKTYRVPNILYISNDMSSRRNNRSLWSYVSFYKYDQIKREARAGKVMTKDGWPVKKQYTFGYVYIGHGSANGVYNLLPGMTSANRERRLRKHYSDHPWKYKGNGNGSWTPNQLQARVGHKVAYIEMFSCMSYYASPKFRTFHSVNGASVTYNYIIKLYARQKPTVYKDKIVNDGEIIRVPVLGVYFGPILPLRPTILHRGSPQRHGKLRYEY